MPRQQCDFTRDDAELWSTACWFGVRGSVCRASRDNGRTWLGVPRKYVVECAAKVELERFARHVVYDEHRPASTAVNGKFCGVRHVARSAAANGVHSVKRGKSAFDRGCEGEWFDRHRL